MGSWHVSLGGAGNGCDLDDDCLAGIIFLRHLVPELNSSISLLVFGSILGTVCGRLCVFLAGLCLGPTFFSAALGFGLLLVGAFLVVGLRPQKLPQWGVEDRNELTWILGLNSGVLLSMAIPFWGVAHLSSKGFAFVPYFQWDFFNHLACTAELVRSVPPQNPYFAGETLHYYWFFHLWPAAVVNLSGITAREAFVQTLPPTVLLFVRFWPAWFGTARPSSRLAISRSGSACLPTAISAYSI